MITAAQFARDVREPLEIRQDIHALGFIGANGERPESHDQVHTLKGRVDGVVEDYWKSTLLSLAEEIGDTNRRPLTETDIPAVAASLCIQFLMADTFPTFEHKHAQNLLEGKRANSIDGKPLNIDVLEPAAVKWLFDALEFGKRAESGKPTIITDNTLLLHVKKRPQIEVHTKHRDDSFHTTKTQLTLGVGMIATMQERSPIPRFTFGYSQHMPTTIGTMRKYKNISGNHERSAREILGRFKDEGKPISLQELYILTVAKKTGLVKKLPKTPIKVAFVRNKISAAQDIESFNQLTKAAVRAGISISLAPPAAPPRNK